MKHILLFTGIGLTTELCKQVDIMKPLIAGLFILLALDLITGIRKAALNKQAITSGGLRKSISKFLEYSIAILASQVFTFVFKLDITLSYYVALFIATIELKSIFENISETTGVDLWKGIRKLIPSLSQLEEEKKKKKESDNKPESNG
jgi:phage-related holin